MENDLSKECQKKEILLYFYIDPHAEFLFSFFLLKKKKVFLFVCFIRLM